jgi:transcriptional regulator with XRE-family HTH domain
MPVNRTAIRDADRALHRQSRQAAEELRSLRIRAGASQAAVAREVGVTRSVISKLELGSPTVTLRTRFRVATVLGADLRLTAFAGSGPLIRDSVQAKIVERLLVDAHPSWRRTIESAVPGPGRRSIDLRLDGPVDSVLIEVETRLVSLEEIVRELHAKRQALAEADTQGADPGRPIHVVLALAATRHHRSILRDHPRTIEAAFPIPSTELSRALRDGAVPWPGDGVLWLPRSPDNRIDRAQS